MEDLFNLEDPIEIRIPMVKSWLAPKRKGNVYYNPRFEEKNYMQDCILNQYRGPLLDCGLRVFFEFYIEMPKSWPKAKREEMYMNYHQEKPDATNCQKLAEDCLKGIVISDDKQICVIGSLKLWDTRNETVIKIWKSGKYAPIRSKQRELV